MEWEKLLYDRNGAELRLRAGSCRTECEKISELEKYYYKIMNKEKMGITRSQVI